MQNKKDDNNFLSFKKPLAASIIFLISVLIFFRPLISQKGFIGWDFLWAFPYTFDVFNSLKNFGGISLWHPYALGGTPIAQSFSFYGYLPNWLNVLGANHSINYSYTVFELTILLHLFLGAFFTYLLARYFKITFWGAIVSGLIFSLSNYLVYKIPYNTMVYSAIWLPLIFLFFHKGINQNKTRDIALSGFFLSISAIEHIQIAYLAGIFLLSYAIFYALTNYKKTFLRNNGTNISTNGNFGGHRDKILLFIKPFVKLAAVSIIALGGSAVLILPLMKYVSLAQHGNFDFSLASTNSLPIIYFLTTLTIPHYFGGLSQLELYRDGKYFILEFSFYTGILSLLLSYLAAASLFPKNKEVTFLSIAALVFLLISFGAYFPVLYGPLYYLLPFFSVGQNPARFMLLFIMPIALLSGFGMNLIIKESNDYLKRKIATIKKILIIIFLYTSFFAIIKLISFPASTNPAKPENVLRDYIIFSFIVIFTYAIFNKWLSGKIPKIILISSLVSILFFDLFLAGFEFSYKDGINPADYYQRTPLLNFLDRKDKTNYRFVSNNLLDPHVDLFYKIPALEHIGIATLRYDKYNERNSAKDTNAAKKKSGNRLNLLNARYFLFESTPQTGNFTKISGINYLYENMDALPRLFIAHNTETITSPDSILAKIDNSDFDPRKTIILEKPTPLKNPSAASADTGQDKADFVYYSPDEINISTYSPNPGMLFLSEMYYPGWKAYVDGSPAEIYQTDYLFRSVYIDKGRHTIKMVFDPDDFREGKIITTTTLLLLIAYFTIDIVRNKKMESFI